MTQQQLTFAVKGPPKPKARPRHTKSGITYTPKATRDYEKVVRTAAMAALSKWRLENGGEKWLTDGPFSLSVFFFFGLNKDGRKPKRPADLDNCLKSISDGIQKLLMDDDSQVDELYGSRDYDSRSPRVVVTVRRLREGE